MRTVYAPPCFAALLSSGALATCNVLRWVPPPRTTARAGYFIYEVTELLKRRKETAVTQRLLRHLLLSQLQRSGIVCDKSVALAAIMFHEKKL